MNRTHNKAFTLIELLVVILIIGILIAILIPAISAARTRAKVAAAQAEMTSLETGIEVFRGEQALGGSYPPSRSDYMDGSGQKDVQLIADPGATTGGNDPDRSRDPLIGGAHLLVQALLGADLLGPPGFKDPDNDGMWADNTHADATKTPPGTYALDPTTGQAKWTRYGSGNGFVDQGARGRISTLDDLINTGGAVAHDNPSDASRKQRFFVDPWNAPILYYRANPAAKSLCGLDTDAGACGGVYALEDNAVLTGRNDTLDTQYNGKGVDFGGGELADATGYYHRIYKNTHPKSVPKPNDGTSDISTAAFDNTFARFVWDKSVKARNEPVRKDAFLLVSAGPDLIYGTGDDVLNWTKSD